MPVGQQLCQGPSPHQPPLLLLAPSLPGAEPRPTAHHGWAPPGLLTRLQPRAHHGRDLLLNCLIHRLSSSANNMFNLSTDPPLPLGHALYNAYFFPLIIMHIFFSSDPISC